MASRAANDGRLARSFTDHSLPHSTDTPLGRGSALGRVEAARALRSAASPRDAQDDDCASKLVDSWRAMARSLTRQQLNGLGLLGLFLLFVALQAWNTAGHTEGTPFADQSRRRQLREEEERRLLEVGNAWALHLVGKAGPERRHAPVLQEGLLTRYAPNRFRISWSGQSVLRGGVMREGGPLELTSLQYWAGLPPRHAPSPARAKEKARVLYTCDGRTGIVYEVSTDALLLSPRFILPAGEGATALTFDCQWLAVKDDALHVGSHGDGEAPGRTDEQDRWVAVIDGAHRAAEIWGHVYEDIKSAMGLPAEGAVLHESAQYSAVHNEWFFLPHRVSPKPFGQGGGGDVAKVLVRCGAAPASCRSVPLTGVGDVNGAPLGFVEFKFLPDGTDSTVVAVRVVADAESPENYLSYLTIFTLDGKVLLPDQRIPNSAAFNGLEMFGRG